jgi:hypothetical protein
VLKALYGLPESAKLSDDELSNTLKEERFKLIIADPCLSIHSIVLIFVFFYVNDMVIAAPKQNNHKMQQLYNNIQTATH